MTTSPASGTSSTSNDATPDDQYLASLPPELPELAFILGGHRSGTTFLYQLLVDTGRFNYVRPFDLIFFDRLLELADQGTIDEEFATLDAELRIQPNRGLDECPAGADVAAEYGAILPKAGQYSLHSPSITPETRARFESLCRKRLHLDDAHPRHPRPLLLKNPHDFYSNIPWLHATYPKALMVFIHRHPLEVLNSQVKAWITLLERDNAYIARVHPYYRGLVSNPIHRGRILESLKSRTGPSDIFSELVKAYRNYLEALPNLSPSSWISLRYEDLCEQPEARLDEVSQFLLEQPLTPQAFTTTTTVKQRPLQLLPHVQAVYDAMAGEVSDYLTAHGYALHPPGLQLVAENGDINER